MKSKFFSLNDGHWNSWTSEMIFFLFFILSEITFFHFFRDMNNNFTFFCLVFNWLFLYRFLLFSLKETRKNLIWPFTIFISFFLFYMKITDCGCGYSYYYPEFTWINYLFLVTNKIHYVDLVQLILLFISCLLLSQKWCFGKLL